MSSTSHPVPRRWLYTTKRWLWVAVVFNCFCALVIMPVTSHPYDIAVLTGNMQAWLQWGFSPFYNWKFGIDYVGLTFLTQGLRALLVSFGVPGTAALHVAWKLPLVAANLVSAGFIYRLGLRFVPGRAAALAALWLVNPAMLWIAAGHGQIESIAVLSVLAALELTLAGHLFVAGLVAGFGVGFEYFPIAVLGAIVVWRRGGYLEGRRPLIAFGAGLAAAVTVCFLPLVLDPIARPSLINGLHTTANIGSQPTDRLLSVWAWADNRWGNNWPLLFAALSSASLVLAWRNAQKGMAVALQLVAVLLLLAVLLDINAIALFAVVAAAGLWLLSISIPVPPTALIVVPTCGVATAFLFLDGGASNATAYFYDDWAFQGANVVSFPQSAAGSTFLGHVFSLGLIATVGYAALRLPALSRIGWKVAAAIGTGLCVLIVLWTAQPAVWQAMLRTAPTANVPDFDPFVATRYGAVTTLNQGTLQVVYPQALVTASTDAQRQPNAGLRITMRDLVVRNGVGKTFPPSHWPGRAVLIPDWERLRNTVDTLWIEALIGSPAWTVNFAPHESDAWLLINGKEIAADRISLVASHPGLTGWALADFRVPARLIEPSGRLDPLIGPDSVLWNGSDNGPWIRIAPAAGTFPATINNKLYEGSYELEPNGIGYALGFPIATNYAVRPDDQALPRYEVDAAVVRWSVSPDGWESNQWLRGVGLAYGIAIALLTLQGLFWLLNTGRIRPLHSRAIVSRAA
jgi:hypothetical protein